MFLRLKGGLTRLTNGLVDEIGPEHVRCRTSVEIVRHRGVRYVVHTGARDVEADAVVFATPAFVTARLLGEIAPAVVPELLRIPYVSTAVVLLAYPEGTGDVLPDSSGFVVPRAKLAMTACTLVSRKWPDPAFADRAVVRCFVGATGIEDIVDEPDADIVEGVSRQLAAVLPLPPEPEAARVVRWPRAMPQYEVGHLERVETIERSLPSGAFVVGQAYGGAGIPDCVRAAGVVAERVRVHFAADRERERAR
jgi:oxygen-dependent protoporphyrinogen oxidase